MPRRWCLRCGAKPANPVYCECCAKLVEPPIKPIPTCYRGRHFRSRLEARWAVFFDALGLEFMYEPEGYELPDGTRYLPDFYFPQIRWYAEVKGRAGECGKAYPFAAAGFCILRLDGEPKYQSYTGFQPVDGSVEQLEYSLDIWTYRKHFNEGRLFAEPDYAGIFMGVTEPEDAFSIRYRAGVTAALSERFERA